MKKILTLAFACLLAYSSSAQFIINEVLYDPADSTAGAQNGDANGDGIRDPKDDEFIEFLNAGSVALDVSRYRIYEVKVATGVRTLRHTIDSGTVVPGRGALVLFGGGLPVGAFGGAIVKADRGTQGLSLNNNGEKVLLTDSSGHPLDSLDIDALSDNPNESYTRNPDFTGAFVQHHLATAGVLFSPGTHIDGTPFAVVAIRHNLPHSTLQIYPNPSAGLVNLPSMEGKIQVQDLAGKPLTPPISGRQLDMRSYPAGVYAVSILGRSTIATARVLITR